MQKNYRKLSAEEISVLTANGCSAENWNDVEVASEGFNVEKIVNCRFESVVKIGRNVSIRNVLDAIRNYIIEDDVTISNVDLLSTKGVSTFGNGTAIKVLNETGGREVRIYDNLSAQVAYVLAMYRHRPKTISAINDLIDIYIPKITSAQGVIGSGSEIRNSGALLNLRVGPNCVIDGAAELSNGTINSTSEAPAKIGRGVIARDFIISSSAEVSDSAIIEKCFIGQGCVISKGFSAENCLFFANCVLMNGEANAVFAGPYCVSHHKSSLMIGGMFSFYNAGSGSNQSNHYYRLGAVHQGVLERGVKMASSSYLLFPARIGAFSIVKGRHNNNIDSSLLPFSYLLEHNGETVIVPAASIANSGAARDAMKWPVRDMRKGSHTLDMITFKMLNPYTVGKMVEAVTVLKSLVSTFSNKEYVSYNNAKIRSSSIKKAIKMYNLAIDKYIGGIVAGKLNNTEWKNSKDVMEIMDAGSRSNYGEWVDVGGLIAPLAVVNRILNNIDDRTIDSVEALHSAFDHVYKNYRDFEWVYVVRLLASRLGKPVNEITSKMLIPVLERWKESVAVIDAMFYDDARKEFSDKTKVSYGIDGDEETKQADFDNVRGKFEDNSFVLGTKEHTHRKAISADRLIDIFWKMQ